MRKTWDMGERVSRTSERTAKALKKIIRAIHGFNHEVAGGATTYTLSDLDVRYLRQAGEMCHAAIKRNGDRL
jgi:hypothetical protein